MAEAVFAHQASEHPTLSHKIKVDSCGTGAYHVGDTPDERTVETCVKVGRRLRFDVDRSIAGARALHLDALRSHLLHGGGHWLMWNLCPQYFM